MSIRVDHDYPNPGDLKVVDKNGDPIKDVEIRIFTQIQYNTDLRDAWSAETTTDLNGEWVDSVWLPSGTTWVIQFQKVSMYGPTHIEITT